MMAATQEGGGAVLQAKEYLKSVMEGRPPAFHGPYARQIAGLYDRIMNRTAFRSGASEDPLLSPEEGWEENGGAAYDWYARRLKEAARDGTEVDAWRI